MKKPTAIFMSLLLSISMIVSMPTSVMAAEEHTPPLSSTPYPTSYLYQNTVYFPSDRTVWDLHEKKPVLKDSYVNQFVWKQVYADDRDDYYSAAYKDSSDPKSNTVDLTNSKYDVGFGDSTSTFYNVQDISSWYVLYRNGDFAVPGKKDVLLQNVICWDTIAGRECQVAVHGAITAVLCKNGDLYTKYEDYPNAAFKKIDSNVTSLGNNCYEKNDGFFYNFKVNNPGVSYSISSSKLACPAGTTKCIYDWVYPTGGYYYELNGATYWYGPTETYSDGSPSYSNNSVNVSSSGLDSVSPAGDCYYGKNTMGVTMDGTVFVKTNDGVIHSVVPNNYVEGAGGNSICQPKVMDFGTFNWPDSYSESKIALTSNGQYYNSSVKPFSPSITEEKDGFITSDMTDIKNYFYFENNYWVQRTDNTIWNVPFTSSDDDNSSTNTPGTPYQLDFTSSGTQDKIVSGLPNFYSVTVPYGTSLTALNLPTSLSARVNGVLTSISGIVWTTQPNYQANFAGDYVFTAVLPDGYSLDDGVSLPQMTVHVSAASSGHGSGSSGGSSSGSSVGTGVPSEPAPSAPAAAYVSDTTQNFSVNNNYQLKITSQDGAAPQFTVGTSGVFDVQVVNTSGNDYYFKLTAIGAPGDKAGIYINGKLLLVATVGTDTIYAKLDTGRRLPVKAGKTYQFKITALKKPVFTCGNGNIFKVRFIGAKGNDYFFMVTAVGKAGGSAGFYVNQEKTPRTVGTIA